MGQGERSRPARVAERIRAELMELVLRGAIRDPRVKDVVISDVRVTDDLSIARIYVRTLGDPSDRVREQLVEALRKAAGFLRREIGGKLRLRRVPDLEFFWDEVIDRAVRMESILEEMREGGEMGEDADGADGAQVDQTPRDRESGES